MGVGIAIPVTVVTFGPSNLVAIMKSIAGVGVDIPVTVITLPIHTRTKLMLRDDALFASRKNPKGFRAVSIRLVLFGEWEAVFVALEDLQMLLFAVLLTFQDENDQESMKIVKKSGNKDMMSNDAQWQAWVAFKNSGGVGGGAAPPICKQNRIIEHDQRC